MQLNNEILAKFVGGQLEIQNQGEDYIFRGEIKTAEIIDGDIKVTFAWLAKGKDGFPPSGWIKADDMLEYAVDAQMFAASDIGDGRISIYSGIVGETSVFYPPDGSRLSLSQVEGFHRVV